MNIEHKTDEKNGEPKLEAAIMSIREFLAQYVFTMCSVARWLGALRKGKPIDLTDRHLLRPLTFLAASTVLLGAAINSLYSYAFFDGESEWFQQASSSVTQFPTFLSLLQILVVYTCVILFFKGFGRAMRWLVDGDTSLIDHIGIYVAGWAYSISAIGFLFAQPMWKAIALDSFTSTTAIWLGLISCIINLIAFLFPVLVLISAVLRLFPSLTRWQRVKVFVMVSVFQQLVLIAGAYVIGFGPVIKAVIKANSQYDSPVEGRVHPVKHKMGAQSLEVSLYLFNRKDEPLLLYINPIYIENLSLGHSGESDDDFEPIKLKQTDRFPAKIENVKVGNAATGAIVLKPRDFVELNFEVILDSNDAQSMHLDRNSEIRFHLVFLHYGHIWNPGDDGPLILRRLKAEIYIDK
ncbi:MAG: hypothetical protein WDM80_05360 [Limisphaerales bacterium]